MFLHIKILIIFLSLGLCFEDKLKNGVESSQSSSLPKSSWALLCLICTANNFHFPHCQWAKYQNQSERVCFLLLATRNLGCIQELRKQEQWIRSEMVRWLCLSFLAVVKSCFSRLQTLWANGTFGLLSYEFLCLCLLTPISVKQNTKLWDMPCLQVGNSLTFSCFPNLSN